MKASLPIYFVFFFVIGFVVLVPEVVLYLPKTFLPESVGCFKGGDGKYICPP
jgi:C4-dicarboxylate transporter, DctM subunit